MMFKVLVIQAANNLSDERPEFLINDRLSFMRFLGLQLCDRAPDARTIWLFREKLTKAGAVGLLFERFDETLRRSGYIAMLGQIVEANLIAAPRQRNTEDEKKTIKEGRVPDAWKDKPAKHAKRIATDAGQSSSPRPSRPRTVQRRRSIWRSRSLAIRTTSRSITALASSANDARRTPQPMKAAVYAKDFSQDQYTAHRSKANEEFMEENGFVSHVEAHGPRHAGGGLAGE
jgi:IS5 family transposase